MFKALLWLLIGLTIIAAVYYTGVGLMHLYRALVREDDYDEAAELTAARKALQEETDRYEHLHMGSKKRNHSSHQRRRS